MKSKFQFHIYARDGFKNVCNHVFMSFSSVLTLIITLSLCAVVVMFVVNTNSFTRDIESQITLMIEFQYEVTQEQISEVKTMLNSHALVDSWEFTDRHTEREEVIDGIVDGNEHLRGLLEGAQNRLVDIIIIDAIDVYSLDELGADLEALEDHIQFVHHPEDARELITGTTNAIRTVMIVFAGVLMLLAIFLIHNTIKINIYSRQ